VTEDVFTEPELDPHTLANLGPLTGLAGIWEGEAGADVHPVVEGTEADAHVERYELQPIAVKADGTWAYEEDTTLLVLGRDESFHHTDRHLLHKVADPTPNPLAR
jgi:hypothetical protein